MFEVCRQIGANYSRYADDITVSSNDERAVEAASSFTPKILEAFELEQNFSKTRLLRESDRKIVTGLDVTTDTIRPPRAFRKSTSAMLRVFLKYERVGMAAQIHGKLCFWNSIAPDDSELSRLWMQFRKACKKMGVAQTFKIDRE